jgi:hypothetical protein
MKSKILAASLLLAMTINSSFAFHKNPDFPETREISVKALFQKIVVDKNFQLVLIQNPNKSSVTIAGHKENLQDVEVNIIDGQLTITSKKNMNYNKIVVYVPIGNLSLLKLASGASVSGEGALKFDNLTVLVNTGSQVNLKALGSIILKSSDDCELVYEKNEKYKIVYE